MIRTRLLLAAISILLTLNACQEQDKGPARIDVLFLGHDSQHHDSEKYMPLLAHALTKEGFNFHYTNDPSDLRPEVLADYDALMLYANHDSIKPQEEKALLDFVRKGKGFLPIHCASYCFRNSDEFVSLVGAQFKSHETGTFTAEIVNSDHPITQDLQAFETWDETYVHHLHNEDRTILMEREENGKREPWTWTREYGKGRVFYTAYGHDERSWGNPGFHELIKRAILWAVGEGPRNRWEQLQLPELEYATSGNIANYERREQPLPLQSPLPAEESSKLIQVPPGFKLELFAEEPDIINPIAMDWDEKGRLWVIETVDYPNEVRSNDQGDDRIKICEDTDGDGKADKFTIFADGLNIPTSIVFANGGVIISMAPHFVFLKDTDGDDKADIRENIISGWGVYDTHAGPSNLTYGFDNQIWGTVGYSGFEGKVGTEEFKFGQAFYRFTADGSEMEFLTNTSNNTWGLAFSETFDVFGSTANNAHSWYMAIPNRYFRNIKGIAEQGSKKIASYYRYHPVTEHIRQVDVFGGFTAAAGHSLYTARSFPKAYWNQVAFVCEPTGHLLAKAVLEKEGAGFVTRDGWNVIASSDEWVSPVHAEVGPDGALWIADWYNFIIQHNPTPNPERGGYKAENGKGNAHINPLRDRKHGRIYRLVYEQAAPYKPLSLSKEDPNGLIKALKHDNMFWRMTAQRLLVERGQQDIIEKLYAIINNKTVDEIGTNGPAVHALWTLHGLGGMNGNNEKNIELVKEALNHPAAGVRKAACQILPNNWWARQAILNANLLKDPDPHTQLAALLKISDMPSDDQTGELIYQLSQSDTLAQDLWLSQALAIAANTHKEGFFAAYQADQDATTFDPETEAERPFIPNPWQGWDRPSQMVEAWPTMQLPNTLEAAGLKDFNGRIMYVREFRLPNNKESAWLNLGPLDESDRTFANGNFIGETRMDNRKNRRYEIPVRMQRPGINYVVVELEDRKEIGGFLAEKEGMYVEQGGKKISLEGAWHYQVIEKFRPSLNASDFGTGKDLAAKFVALNPLVANDEEETTEELKDNNAQQITIRALKNEMKYDLNTFTVKAGQTVEITFVNEDLLQHNLLITAPGTLEMVGKAAEKMAMEPEGMEKGYVPELSAVLYAVSLVDPNQKKVLRFKAPEETGDYPFVCTFPGHWTQMNGIMKVEAKEVQ